MTDQQLILIRGLPGSGKSTFASWLQYSYSGRGYNINHYEADQWQTDDGVYNWKPERVAFSHKMCQNNTSVALSLGHDVIVSNTFTRMWEMLPYLKMAKEFGAKVTVLTCEGNHSAPGRGANGNVHSVPEDVIEKMRARWEPYVSLNDE